MERLQRKNVLITGASSGIGQAIAVRFAAEGANIAINYRSGAEQAEATRAMAKAARSNGAGRELVVQADVSNEEQVKKMFATTIEAFGGLDVLVNNAGIQKPCPSHPALPLAPGRRSDPQQFERARNHTETQIPFLLHQ
jgi:glucose 1-dehydrogenase